MYESVSVTGRDYRICEHKFQNAPLDVRGEACRACSTRPRQWWLGRGGAQRMPVVCRCAMCHRRPSFLKPGAFSAPSGVQRSHLVAGLLHGGLGRACRSRMRAGVGARFLVGGRRYVALWVRVCSARELGGAGRFRRDGGAGSRAADEAGTEAAASAPCVAASCAAAVSCACCCSMRQARCWAMACR